MSSQIQHIIQKLESGFFGFWVRNYRISFLAIIFIVILGSMSLYLIPKESNPDIDFGIISVSTVYTGVSPEDIDALITTKIEDEIDDVEGIKKITSTSRLGVSSTILELDPDVDVTKTLQDVKDAVDSATLPDGAQDTLVSEVGSDNEAVFTAYISGPADQYSHDYLTYQANRIQDILTGT